MALELYDCPGAAAYLELSASRIRQLCLSGELKAEKVGNRWIITLDELKRFKAAPRRRWKRAEEKEGE
jgi:excisionase family DNA binding protein